MNNINVIKPIVGFAGSIINSHYSIHLYSTWKNVSEL